MRRLLLVLLPTALLTLACAEPPAPPPGPLRIAIHGDPISLDPHLQNEMLTFAVLLNIFEGLTSFDPDLTLVPALAVSWENPSDLIWRFYLRPGVVFHDGRRLAAEDVVFSIRRARDHPRSNLSSYLLEVTDVEAIDELTVELRTARPFPILLNKLVYIAILPRGTPEQIGRLVGTGPYRFTDYRPRESLELSAFEGHWRGVPAVRDIRFLPTTDPARRLAGLLAGELDIAQELPPAGAAEVAASPDCRLEPRLGLEVEYLHLRLDAPPFSDRRVRQAVDLALDRQLLVEEVLFGHGMPAAQMVSPNVFGYAPGLEPTRRDLQASRRLLAEAGYPDGLDLTLELREGRRGEAIRAQLAEAGIRATLKISPWPVLFRRLVAGEVSFYYGGVLCPSADASDLLDGFCHTREPERGYGLSNFGRYSNPALDALIEQSATAIDMRQRRRLLQRSIHLLAEDLPFVPLHVTASLWGMRRDIEWTPRMDRLIHGWEIRRSPRTGSSD